MTNLDPRLKDVNENTVARAFVVEAEAITVVSDGVKAFLEIAAIASRAAADDSSWR